MSKYNYFSSNMPSTIKTECDIDINLTYDYNSQSKLLYGPIWYYFLNGSSQKKGSDTSSFNLYTGESTLAKSGNIDTTQIKNYRIYPTNGCSSNILSGSNYTSTDCSFYNNQVLNAYYNNETNRLIINNIPYSSDDLNHQPIENMMRELSDSLYNEVIGFGLNISGNETVNVGTDDVYNTTNERN